MLGPAGHDRGALHGQAELGDRFDEVRERARNEALARELKFGVTDVNGWQTAYGYDGGRSRPRFERAVADFRADLRAARSRLTDAPERALLPATLLFLSWTRETGVPAALVGVLAGLGVPSVEIYASVVALAIVLTLLLQALPAQRLASRVGLLG